MSNIEDDISTQTPELTAKRDRQAYELARSFVLTWPGVTEQVLERYTGVADAGKRASTMAELYESLLRTAQSAQHMANAIGGSIGGVGNLRGVLSDFDPANVSERYPHGVDGCGKLFADIKEQLQPRGKLRDVPNASWPRYCRSITSGAAFLAQFASPAEFYGWVDQYIGREENEDGRIEAARQVAARVDGFGFALACNFLKEAGYHGYSKPDVHIRDIFLALGLADKGDDITLFRAVSRVARHAGVTPYTVDALFWLVGSGNLYMEGVRPTGRKQEFIKLAESMLEQAPTGGRP